MTDRENPRLKLAFYLVLLGYVVNLLYRTTQMGTSTAQIFPYLFGTVSAIILLILIGSVLMPETYERLAPDVASGAQAMERDRGNLKLWTMGLVSTFPFAVYLFGFSYVVPLYVFVLVYAVGRNPKHAVVVSVLFTFSWWLIFIRLLHIGFFEGILF